jgi:hypothetical protein
MPAIDPGELEQQMRELLRELDPEDLLVGALDGCGGGGAASSGGTRVCTLQPPRTHKHANTKQLKN